MSTDTIDFLVIRQLKYKMEKMVVASSKYMVPMFIFGTNRGAHRC